MGQSAAARPPGPSALPQAFAPMGVGARPPMLGGPPAGPPYPAPRAAYGAGAPMQSVVSADGSTLRLRGLPYSAGVDEITEFFAGAAPLVPCGQ